MIQNKEWFFQVAVMTNKGYIIEHKDFPQTKTGIEATFHYMTNIMMHEEFNKFEIVRWDHKGNRV